MSTKVTDIAAILGKGSVGWLPFVGPLAAEIVGAVIPNQRIDRIESLLKILESKIAEEDKPHIEEKIRTPESVDLIEDCFIQASRALSEERKEYIASLLKNSLTNDDLKHIEYKKLLSLLGELNDLEVLILKSHTIHDNIKHKEFWKTHEDALTPPVAHMGSPQEQTDKHTIFQTHTAHLVRLGLFKIRFKKPKSGEFPKFDDKTGMIKAEGHDTTALGRLLLRSIDQGP